MEPAVSGPSGRGVQDGDARRPREGRDGERAKLDELRRTDEFERFSMRLARLFDGYRVVPGVTEEGLRKVAERNPEMFK